MDESMINRLDLEVINSLQNTLDIAFIQCSEVEFISMNKSALLLFGFESMNEARDYSRKMAFADTDVFMYISSKLKAYGSIHNERVLFKRKDQTNFWGKLTSVRRVTNREVIYYEKIVDITSEVEHEHQLAEKSHLLEKVSDELDRFIYSASHDLRSPVTTMLGLLQLMKRDPVSANNQYVAMLEQSIMKLESHIQILVDFSKTTNERILCEKIDFEEQLLYILSDLKQHICYERTIFQSEVTGDAIIFSDGSKIRSILYQIIKNAFDYTDIRKSHSFISVNFSLMPGKCVVEITDNGMGIPKEHIPNVCKMFYRATSSSRGSGLGLFVAKEAVTKIQGWMEIVSEYGIGTSVIITIPDVRINSVR